jgi:hypothetical protein
LAFLGLGICIAVLYIIIIQNRENENIRLHRQARCLLKLKDAATTLLFELENNTIPKDYISDNSKDLILLDNQAVVQFFDETLYGPPLVDYNGIPYNLGIKKNAVKMEFYFWSNGDNKINEYGKGDDILYTRDVTEFNIKLPETQPGYATNKQVK